MAASGSPSGDAALKAADAELLTTAFLQLDVNKDRCIDRSELYEALSKAWPAASSTSLQREVQRILDECDKNGDGHIDMDEFFLAFGVESGNARAQRLLQHLIGGSFAQHLDPQQLAHLAFAFVPHPPEFMVAALSDAELPKMLQRFFPALESDEREDIAMIVADTAVRDKQGKILVEDFLSAVAAEHQQLVDTILQHCASTVTAGDNHREPAPYSTPPTLGIDVMAPEERDLLRDAFIHLDSDGDGFVTLQDLVDASASVFGESRESTIEKLRPNFDAVDIRKEGSIGLSAFVMSFTSGFGVIPRNVVEECISGVRLRLSDAQVELLQQCFHTWDCDADGRLGASDLVKALQKLLANDYPQLQAEDYDSMAAVVLDAADYDRDGFLNVSEFLRSFQEAQGVLPTQFLQPLAVQLMLSLDTDVSSQLTELVTHLSGKLPEFVEKPALAMALHDAIDPEVDIPEHTINNVVNAMIGACNLSEDGLQVSLRSFVMKLSKYTTDETVACALDSTGGANTPSKVLSTHPPPPVDASTSEVKTVPRPPARHNNNAHSPSANPAECSPIKALPRTSSLKAEEVQVLQVPQAQSKYEKLFRYLDKRSVGYLELQDLFDGLCEHIKKQNTTWPERTVAVVAETLFCAANTAEDGHLTLEEFTDSFVTGYGIFPDDYVEEMNVRLIRRLSRGEVQRLIEALEAISAMYIANTPTKQELERSLEGALQSTFDGDATTVRTIVLAVSSLFEAHCERAKVPLSELVHAIAKDPTRLQLPLAFTVTPARESPYPHNAMGSPSSELQLDASKGGTPHPHSPPLQEQQLELSKCSAHHNTLRAPSGEASLSATQSAVETDYMTSDEDAEYLRQLVGVFRELEAMRRGYVAPKELEKTLTELIQRQHPEWDESDVQRAIAAIMAHSESDPNGQMSLDAFVRSFIGSLPETPSQRQIHKLSWKLTEQELQGVLEAVSRLDEAHKHSPLLVTDLMEWLNTALTPAIENTEKVCDISEAILSQCPPSSGGTVDFHAFVVRMRGDPSLLYAERPKHLSSWELEQIRNAFRAIDTADDGYVTEEALRRVLRKTSAGLSMETKRR